MREGRTGSEAEGRPLDVEEPFGTLVEYTSKSSCFIHEALYRYVVHRLAMSESSNAQAPIRPKPSSARQRIISLSLA